jgi:hypothetical protein
VTSGADTLTVPDFLSIREAAAVLRIGRTCAYELAQQYVHTGGGSGLKVVRVGRQPRVPLAVLEEMLGDSITWPIESHEVADDDIDAKQAPRHNKPKRTQSEQPPRLFPLYVVMPNTPICRRKVAVSTDECTVASGSSRGCGPTWGGRP